MANEAKQETNGKKKVTIIVIVTEDGSEGPTTRIERVAEMDMAELSTRLTGVVDVMVRGLICICAWCRRIKGDDGKWRQLESHLDTHMRVDTSHGICPECIETPMRK